MGYYIKCSEEQMKMLMEDKWVEGSLERLIESGDIIEVKTPHRRLIDESVLNERAKLWMTNFNLGMTLYEQLDEFYKVAEIPTVIEAEVE